MDVCQSVVVLVCKSLTLICSCDAPCRYVVDFFFYVAIPLNALQALQALGRPICNPIVELVDQIVATMSHEVQQQWFLQKRKLKLC